MRREKKATETRKKATETRKEATETRKEATETRNKINRHVYSHGYVIVTTAVSFERP